MGLVTLSIYLMSIITLSSRGIVSDASVLLNSTTFGTDQTAAIQAVLDLAITQPGVNIVCDVQASATQLKIHSNTILTINSGCGFIQRDFSNKPFIVNFNRSFTINDTNITINGTGTLNGNGYRAGVEKQTKEGAEGWICICRFAGVSNLSISGISLINGRSFSSFVSKFSNVSYTNVYCRAQQQLNQDGCKFMVGQTLRITNLTGEELGDDILSICANDGFWPTNPPPTATGGGQTAFDPYAVYGPISDCIVDTVTWINCTHGLRLLSGDQLISNVQIKNLSGNMYYGWLIMDNYSEAPANIYGAGGVGSTINTGHFENISFENVNITLTVGGYKNAYAYLNGKDIKNIVFRNYTIPNTTLQPYPGLLIDTGSIISNLAMPGFSYAPNPAITQSKITNNGTVINFSVNIEKNISAIDKNGVFLSTQNLSFLQAGIDATNMQIVWKIGNPNKSYKPGRTINAFNGFEPNGTYYVNVKRDIYIAGILPPIANT